MPIPKNITGFNKHVTNKIILTFAGWLQPFAVIRHKGRHSGKIYRTPVLAFSVKEEPRMRIVVLTYGRNVDWLKNLFAAGSGELECGGYTIIVSGFSVVPYTGDGKVFPHWVRIFLSLISVKDCLYMNSLD
jgi:deazaflavin-dependent oxidoreductase (nitroreductase family)